MRFLSGFSFATVVLGLLLIAAWFGEIRLIDNLLITPA